LIFAFSIFEIKFFPHSATFNIPRRVKHSDKRRGKPKNIWFLFFSCFYVQNGNKNVGAKGVFSSLNSTLKLVGDFKQSKVETLNSLTFFK
jgi:hypothetical protein